MFSILQVILAQLPAPLEINFIHLLPAALLLLWPIGLILLTSSALPEAQAPAAAINLLVTWAVAALAYFAVGFAFQFGGIAQVTPAADLRSLYWEWYPLDQSVDFQTARFWGVIALQGWLLAGAVATPGALALFAGHVSLVGVTALLPAAVLIQRGRVGMALWLGALTGAIIYPLPGNWLWGGGWLANLGASLGLGHGLVDFGGAGGVFLAGSLAALAALLVFKPTPAEHPTQPNEVIVPVINDSRLTVYDESGQPTVEKILPLTPMPSAYLPILGVMGAGLTLLGWMGLAAGIHTPTAINFSPAQAAVNGLLAALSAALAAAAYSWFVTRQVNPLMTARGLTAGLVVAAAGAPFIPTWILVVAGLLTGLLLPLLIYLFNQGLRLADELGVLATYGFSALVSLALVGLFADGRAGGGWNGVGLTSYLGAPGQGVSGLVVAAGFAADWPGQLQAQLLGLAAIAGLAVGGSLLLLQTLKAAQNSWQRSGLEWATPKTAPSDPPPAVR